jgi:hypothetical protein
MMCNRLCLDIREDTVNTLALVQEPYEKKKIR